MRGLLLLAVLCQGLVAGSPEVCKLYEDQAAVDQAVYLINKLHHHGYKFKLDSFTKDPTPSSESSCQPHFTLTLSETKCHIVNPKPFNECQVRETYATPITAKCNVTLCDGGEKPGIAHLDCDTEPASNEQILRSCPDCPTLLPLHDPHGLESVKAAIEKFNKDSNQTSYFKLLEVGRLSTQYNMMFGMTQFAEFALVETECPDNVKNEEKSACKQKCPNEAHHGFCKSTQLGNGNLTVNCEIYDIQNTTHPHPPFHRGKQCGRHERPPQHPGHHERGEHGSLPGHHERGEHGRRPGHHERGEHGQRPGHPTRPGQPKDPEHPTPEGPPTHQVCFTGSAIGPFHRGPPHHGGPTHHGGPPHHGGPHRGGPPHHKDHGEHDHDHKKPHPKPPQEGAPSSQPTPPGSEEHQDFSFQPCHGAVKIPPSIYPICPFPPSFHGRGHHRHHHHHHDKS